MSEHEHKTAFPLCWPDGWKRSQYARRSAFGRHTMDKVRWFLQSEMKALGVPDYNFILSTNCKLRRLDGQPASGQPQPYDKGLAVYFKLKNKPVALACDKWDRVECNVYSIAKHLEALRGQERWGVGNIEQAFRGYLALPGIGESGGDRPWEVLGVPINAGEEQILSAFRVLAKKYHPDNPETGDAAEFNRIKTACDMMTQNLKNAA